MIKAVIFDLDNTLLDFMKMKLSSIKAAISGMIESGLVINPEQATKEIFDIYNKKGYEYQDVLNEFIINKVGTLDYKILAGGIVEYKKAKEESLSLYPEVYQTLILLSKMGLRLGIVSDAPSREAWIRLYTVKIHHLFDEVVTFNDTGVHKPGKEPFELIINKLNVDFQNCIMIGDWPDRDIEGAKKLGMKTAFAKYGSMENIFHSGADYDLEHITDIVSIVKNINHL